ncbi:unnamed protein product [Diamesa serratosioi]
MKLPDRWLDYKPVGEVIPGTRFICFKVPLRVEMFTSIPNERHTTHDVLESIPNLGMIVNLTNTQNDTKYYNPRDWPATVNYLWLKTEGHVTPARHLLLQFCREINKFVKNDPDRLIGIHCTHGVNRTGFFVCAYMVLCLNIKPNDALKFFADGRGHKLERNNYIDAVVSYKDNVELKEQIKEPSKKKERIQKQSRWGNEEEKQPDHLEAVKAVSSYGEWRAAKRLREETETIHKNHHHHHHHHRHQHRDDYSQDNKKTSWRSGGGSIPQRSLNKPSHESYKRESSRIPRAHPDTNGYQPSRFNAPGRDTAISSLTSATTTSAVHNSRFKKSNV